MRITFGEREIECRTYEDQSSFDESLGQKGVDSIIVGDDAEGQRGYHIISVHSAVPSRTTVRIGVVASIQGIVPKVMLRPASQDVWVGFGNRVVVIDTAVPLIRFVFETESVFYQFLPMSGTGMTLLLHETGLVAVSDGGEVVWAVSTDVVSAVRLSAVEVVLEFMDDEPLSLDPQTGRRQ